MVAIVQTRHMVTVATAVAAIFACLLTACRSTPTTNVQEASDHSMANLSRVPSHVTRVAVWYPRTADRQSMDGYLQLEQATFRLTQHRAGISIVDRRHLKTVMNEQRFQLSGRIGDDHVVRIGHLLGADSLVVFEINQPSWRDRVWARWSEEMVPVVVSSKIIAVETGEVLYHDVVRTWPTPTHSRWDRDGSDAERQSAVRTSLDHAVSLTISHLEHAFR